MASDADTMNNPLNRKFKCWAAACGGCGEGLSAEHIVSKCLFPEGVVHVSGFVKSATAGLQYFCSPRTRLSDYGSLILWGR